MILVQIEKELENKTKGQRKQILLTLIKYLETRMVISDELNE